MGQIHHKSVTLAALCQRSQVIAVAQLEPEPHRYSQEHIAIGTGEKQPPFVLVRTQVTVLRLLKDNPIAAPRDKVGILPADWQDQLDLHRRYYLEGMDEHPLYARIEGTATNLDEPVILFLRSSGRDGWELAVRGAMLPLAREPEITALLAKAGKVTPH